MLERFRTAKAGEIARLEALSRTGAFPLPYAGKRPPFAGSLRTKGPFPVIAEYKRASPSKGDIDLSLEPEIVADAYAAAGAGAMSVLTETDYFKGDTAFLERMTGPGLPLLRKDFILDPIQIDQTAASPASAVLIIVRMVDDRMLRVLLERCIRFGLEAVVEVFDEQDLARAKRAGGTIIQVNNRDLDTLAVDCALSERLIAGKSGSEFWITASGIESGGQLRSLIRCGFDAALVGSFLMQGGAPEKALGDLLGDAASGAAL
jgi:Indole-3-glycerol phosphate synthase